ncbi:glycoside hydrolase [Mycena albidolilacea]|uniref:mannan endo-1,4-beta-mannosidase n=1 Tax=Mycena albidolilacea TaxID=1033008 RepID=A0AAD6ZM15_9AGAR|nr:glycoside hydrolase [Mycena albidolilacea]
MIRSTLLTLALSLTSVAGQAVEWGQCGGMGWMGATTCVSGTVCTELNEWYFQCLPGTATTTVSTTPPTSTSSAPTSTASAPVQTGFVKTSGTKFTLNGAPYTLFGTNAYWLALGGYSTTDINKAFSDIAASGATTVRGFNEVTSANGVYFHLWSGKTATVNTGSNGLGMLDTVIAAAKAHGLRLIISLSDYGGMDVYAAQLLGSGQPHDVFYTNPTIIVRLLEATEPRLVNEPRCSGSSTTASSSCTVSTITTWVSTMSAFIKSIDSNHLVGLGDEGFFNQPGNSDYMYQGSAGIDFAANLKISTIDFGTFHQGWGETNTVPWGNQWITDHATTMKSTNKPVIMKEFGISNSSSRASTYSTWYQTIISTGLTGDLIWQAGSQLTNGPTSNDGFAIYPTDPVYAVMQSHAAALKARG